MKDENHDENTVRLTHSLEDQIDYYRREYKVTYATVIGVLEMLKLQIWQEAYGDES